ncbi:hypothetical protein [Halomonas sp. DQ26W]|uniref:hypothetical protein n=1 Tax=Halomonas sp. DQ26W TaxID=2282311 RepID=UPI0011C02D90|nr:hypothetical protein [Halomonas sp. DQ26W]
MRTALLLVLLGLGGCAALPPGQAGEAAPCGWTVEEWRSIDGGYLDERFVRLRQPVALDADIEGLWFYDAGHDSIFLLEAVSDRLRRVATLSASREVRLRLDGVGQLYLADPRAGSLLRLDTVTGEAQSFARESPLAPTAVALDRLGRVLVGDGQAGRVVAYNAHGGFEAPVADDLPPLGGVAGLLARDEQLWIVDPVERRVHLVEAGRARVVFTHSAWVSPGPLADDGRGGVVMADTATRTLYRLTAEGPVEVLTPVPLDVQRIDDLVGDGREIYLADGARGQIRVLDLVPLGCPVAPGEDATGDDNP